ncbi:hypothetical protein NO932_08630 [Pelagibacterium sp. 26DY04]|uniref:hypothetical protein n=1 Tax=Pelagibacterium sp. 26DY04 TaxID=2967130 RepID=UPI002815E4AC|nr:hypothetical protein [Pelagibacterium sp. 26DY04]WMT88654.1 hypothetical protein NO932_08630 [Pelagibacterium sp. 26DY04]
MDWYEKLKKHGDLAQSFAHKVAEVLKDDTLTIDQASKLYRTVSAGAQTFDDFSSEMDEYDLHESMFEAAEAIESIWDKLTVAVANRVRTMQGLEPIEMPDDED